MLPPSLQSLDDAALRRLEASGTLSDADWRAVLAEITRRSGASTPAQSPASAASSSASAIAIGHPAGVRITGVDLPFDDLFKLTFKITLASALSALTIGAVLLFVWMIVAPFIR